MDYKTHPLMQKEHITKFYNEHDCWGDDCFSRHTTRIIGRLVRSSTKGYNKQAVVLNAGSGGNLYGTTFTNMYHVDIAKNKLKGLLNSFVSSIEDMPFQDKMFDIIICVGTVINYCDIERAFGELVRVLKDDGIILLEYERSGSALIDVDERNKDCIIFEHNYEGENHANLLYSDSYVEEVLENNGLYVKKYKYFHTTIPFIQLLVSQKISEILNIFDGFISRFHSVNKYSHNKFLVCEKKTRRR